MPEIEISYFLFWFVAVFFYRTIKYRTCVERTLWFPSYKKKFKDVWNTRFIHYKKKTKKQHKMSYESQNVRNQ